MGEGYGDFEEEPEEEKKPPNVATATHIKQDHPQIQKHATGLWCGCQYY